MLLTIFSVCACSFHAVFVPHCTLQANYGQKDPAAVARVKEVYMQLGMAAKFEAYEADSYSKLSSTIEEQGLLPKQVFTSLLKKIYKRSK
jgi:farnesyl diphosphate synthase